MNSKNNKMINFLKEANKYKYKGNLWGVFEMGFDAGFNKATKENCHFGLFATPKMTKIWEEGNKLGIKEKNEKIL